MACDYTTIDLCVRAGDRNEVLLQVLTDGDPTDLTGATLTAQARLSPTDPAPALTATVATPDPADGQVRIAWDGEDVRAALGAEKAVRFVWDLNIVMPGETLADTPCGGKLEAVMDVTRAGV